MPGLSGFQTWLIDENVWAQSDECFILDSSTLGWICDCSVCFFITNTLLLPCRHVRGLECPSNGGQFSLFSQQTVTLFWGTLRFSPSTPSSTAPTVSASSPAMPAPSSCKRAAPVTSCTARRPATGSRLRSKELWMTEESLRRSWSFIRRKVRASLQCLFANSLLLTLKPLTEDPGWSGYSEGKGRPINWAPFSRLWRLISTSENVSITQ